MTIFQKVSYWPEREVDGLFSDVINVPQCLQIKKLSKPLYNVTVTGKLGVCLSLLAILFSTDTL